MQLVWSDECTGAAGTPPNPALWGLKQTDQYQSAGELQYYTTGTNNAVYNGNGHLVITARKETTNGFAYSSGRAEVRRSTGTKQFSYGLFQARIISPTAVGTWPAFWLLGDDGTYGWPWCGEIDVMERPVISGTAPQAHQGSHSPDGAGNDVAVGVAPSTAVDGWHVYSCRWTPDKLVFYIDRRATGTVTQASVEASGGTWVFNAKPQAPILNLAVGGWAGTPDPAWTTQTMVIDWVRIYQ